MSKTHDNFSQQLDLVDSQYPLIYLFKGYSSTNSDNYTFVNCYLDSSNNLVITTTDQIQTLNLIINRDTTTSLFYTTCKTNEYMIIIQHDPVNSLFKLYDMNASILLLQTTTALYSVYDSYNFVSFENIVYIKALDESIVATILLNYDSTINTLTNKYGNNVQVFNPNFNIEKSPITKGTFSDLLSTPIFKPALITYSPTLLIDQTQPFFIADKEITVVKVNSTYTLYYDETILTTITINTTDELLFLSTIKIFAFVYVIYNSSLNKSFIYNYRNELLIGNVDGRIISWVNDIITNTTYFFEINKTVYNKKIILQEVELYDFFNSRFIGTDGINNGKSGLVPAPISSQSGLYLRSDGTWSNISPLVEGTNGNLVSINNNQGIDSGLSVSSDTTKNDNLTIFTTQAIKNLVSGGSGGGFNYLGLWNANTNSPTLTNVGTNGSLYSVSVNGTTSLNSINNWVVGDLVYYYDSWQKIPGYITVNSVFNRSGDIVANNVDYNILKSMIYQG